MFFSCGSRWFFPINNIFFSSHLGGYTGTGRTSSTDYLYGNGTVRAGPNLPVSLDRHCVVRLDNDTAMVIGKYISLKSLLLSISYLFSS